ncbi:MAG TPA: hypothetical protein VFK76_00835 [Gaiellaceae bacterium]|nr:hypothetical protein [Gaiellaceae bacterium]
MRRPARPSLALGFLAVVLAAAVLAGPAASSAASLQVTIGRTAQAKAGGKVIAVTGLVRCTSRQRVRLRVAVLQTATGAYAEGTLPQAALCSGGSQQWTIASKIRGSAVFKRGRAESCVLATTRLKQVKYTGLLQSCRSVGVEVTR